MNIYLAIVFFLFVQIVFFSENLKIVIGNISFDSNKLWIIIDIGIILFLAIFRDITIGTDYKNYYSIITGLQNVPFNNIISYADDCYIEIGFVFLSKVLLVICNSPLFVFFVWYLVIIGGIVYFALKNNVDPKLSLYLFITFSLFNQSLNTMRQYIAAAIILFAICKFKEKKYGICAILLVSAISIHYSAIFGIVFVLCYKIKKNISNICLLMVVTAFVAAQFGITFIQYIVNMSGYERYLFKEISSESGVGIIMNLLFFALFYILRKQYIGNQNYNLWILSSALTLSFNFFINDLGMISRMMIYTKVFYTASLQDFVCSFNNVRDRRIIKIIMMSLFFVYYYVSVSGSCFETSPYKLMSF